MHAEKIEGSRVSEITSMDQLKKEISSCELLAILMVSCSPFSS